MQKSKSQFKNRASERSEDENEVLIAFQNLRERYPKFIYQNYSYRISKNNLEILFYFKIEPNIYFKPKIVLENINKSQTKRVGDRALNNLIFNLGLMEIPSYWKATCSPEIKVQAGPLNQEQIKWWKDLIFKGMGQFFYENKIDFTKSNFLEIKTTNDKLIDLRNQSINLTDKNKKNRVLVPVGGGKDSIVTLELLKKAKKNIQCFSLNPTEAAKKIMKMAGFNNPIIVKRTIDPKLLELNRKGFLNGHTPFSAYLAFLSTLIAVLFDLKYVAVSNERSSNEGNVKYLGKIINHQWSKSFEFEKKFRDYSKKYLAAVVKEDKSSFPPSLPLRESSVIEYFSFLRPLYEIQIAKLFSKFPKYFSAFLSCNEAYKTASGTKNPTKKWCGKCSKCLFLFAILYPFVKEKELLKIFGKNLFNNRKLFPTMQELIGVDSPRGFKPFECVGTKKESLIAFYLSWKKYRLQPSHHPPAFGRHLDRVSVGLPFLLNYFEKKILPKYPNLEKESKTIMNSWNNQHNLPFEEILKKMVF